MRYQRNWEVWKFLGSNRNEIMVYQTHEVHILSYAVPLLCLKISDLEDNADMSLLCIICLLIRMKALVQFGKAQGVLTWDWITQNERIMRNPAPHGSPYMFLFTAVLSEISRLCPKYLTETSEGRKDVFTSSFWGFHKQDCRWQQVKQTTQDHDSKLVSPWWTVWGG